MMEIERIIEGCLQGDRRCQHELYERYSPMCYAVCCQYAHNPEDAQDLLMEGFLRVFEKIGSYSMSSPLGAWLRRLFINLAIDHYRANQRDPVALPDEPPEGQLREDAAMRIDVADAIKESMRQLTREEELVFRLVVVEEFTLLEASQQLHLSKSTIKHQLYRARDKVRLFLKARLGDSYELAALQQPTPNAVQR